MLHFYGIRKVSNVQVEEENTKNQQNTHKENFTLPIIYSKVHIIII